MDKLDNLKKLKQLFDEGVISELEFQSMKKEILGDSKSNEDNNICENLPKSKKNNKEIKSIDIDLPNSDIHNKLRISWKGYPWIFDFKIDLLIDENFHSTFFFKKPYNITIPIENKKINVQLKLPNDIKTFKIELENNQSYVMVIKWESKQYDYYLYKENKENIIKQDTIKNIDEINPENLKINEIKSNSSNFKTIKWVSAVFLCFLIFLFFKNNVDSNKSNERLNTSTETSSPSSSGSSSSSSSPSSGSKTCSWCGTSFSGTHYTHLGKMAPCQSSSSSNSIGKYCSMKCCSEARRSSCPTCR